MRFCVRAILFSLTLLIAPRVAGQFEYNLQSYGLKEGLSSQFVNDIFQDDLGYFWIATQSGVYLFDGVNFELLKGDLATSETVCIRQTKDGAIWLGTNTEGLYRYTFDSTQHFVKELPSKTVRNLFIDKDDNLWILTAKGVVKFDGENFLPISDSKNYFEKGVLCVDQAQDKSMWFGTQGNGLIKLENDSTFSYFNKENANITDSYIFSILSEGNTIYLGTTGVGVLKFDKQKATAIPVKRQSESWISRILPYKGNLLIVSSNGLFLFDEKTKKVSEFTVENGLNSNDLYNGFIDKNKNIWIGWKGGLQCIRDKSVLSLKGLENIEGSINCIERGADGKHFFVGTNGKGIYQIHKSGKIKAKIFPKELENTNIIAIRERKNGELWIGSSLSKGLTILKKEKGKYTFDKMWKEFNQIPFTTITDIKEDPKGNIWFSVYNNGMMFISKTDTLFYGEKSGLKNGDIFGFELYNNSPYVFLHGGGVYQLIDNRFNLISKHPLIPKGVIDFKMDKKQNKYFATQFDGVLIEFSNGKTVNINKNNGLLSNKIYSIKAKENQLFIGSNKGINIVVFDGDSIQQIISLSKQSGLKHYGVQENSLLFEGQNLWVCTRTGVSILNEKIFRDMESSSFPINITNLQLFFEDYNAFDKSQQLNKWGIPTKADFNYKENHISFNYGALTINPVKFSYRIVSDGEGEWTKFTEMKQATFSNLQPGSYIFEVKAKDCFENMSNVAKFEFYIDSPLWKKAWFQGLIVGLLFLIGFGIFRYRVMILRRQKKELEAIVQERTQEVREVSKGLEIKNREILDSIEYAQRIQSAMLPNIHQIKEHFKRASLIYYPKDIVAGDFYWFNELGDYKMIAVADCTGHGVPGAMVSIVCHNALNRSVREFELTDPAEILNKTREIVIEEFKEKSTNVNDGMDISLVVLNHKTKEIKWAGANNPIWFTQKNTDILHEIKGTKQPIGHYVIQSSFATHTLNYEEIKNIYLFSDGFADQFGGDRGKKMKPSVFKRKIMETQKMEIEEQTESLNQLFINWKGNLEQLDDVCVMVFKVN